MLGFSRLAVRWRSRARARAWRGELHVIPDVLSPELGNRRSLIVSTPASYAAGDRRYPVLYMQDGQNLFDPRTSFAGDWGLSTALGWASRRGIEPIVVGIYNAGTARFDEYSPFVEPRSGGGGGGGGAGDRYLEFLIRTVKPLVDGRFRTLPDRASTGIAGSSLGGLISLYAFFRLHSVFGFVGAFSPSLWFGNEAIFDVVARSARPAGRIYLDIGLREGERHVMLARRMRDLLIERGFEPRRTLRYVEDRQGAHREADWGRRFRKALPFLVRDGSIT
ncbi:MAG TPA: alpha/beta hydrolase-fold protein [Gemmatimonadales bacterium]|nr:alpha/beta hydrolase-fold protein [Gemmatimonadales bacterium]